MVTEEIRGEEKKRKGMGVIDGMRWFLYSTEERRASKIRQRCILSGGMNLVTTSHNGVGDCRGWRLR
jgi:hypothetical protein